MNPSLSIYLDLIRLLAATLVVFGHAFNFTHGHFKSLAGHGPAAVAVFFVLSGFVIAFVTDIKEKSWREYTVSRAARIFSVAIPALLITIGADQLGFHFNALPYLGFTIGSDPSVHSGYFHPDWSAADFARMLSFTNEIWQSHIQVGSGEPYWSLGFEVWYYIIFGFYLFSPFQGLARYLPALVCALVAGPKICLYLPLWLMGVALYHGFKKHGDAIAKVPTTVLCGGLILSLAIYLLGRRYIAPLTQSMFEPVEISVRTFTTVLYFHLIGAAFGLHLACFHGLSHQLPQIQAVLKRFKEPIQWTAGATFTLYLVHQPLLLATLAITPLPAGGASWAYTSLIAVFLLVLLIAEFSERRKALWRKMFKALLGGGQATNRTVSAN